ncbi:hypothetical protein ACQPU1_10610 [Clostridium paraputrificum]|uniref:hypothetical protein n=1 Tax=Clostridium TaxID=1485 RepID=UPI003D33AC5A
MNIFKRNKTISRMELEAYIGEKAYTPFYTKTLNKFMENPNSPNWSWPSFFIGMYWLMFRKAIIPSLILFAVNFALMTIVPFLVSPIISLSILILMGLFGTNIFLMNAEREISKLKMQNPGLDEVALLSKIGSIGGTTYLYPVLFYLGQTILYSIIY